jgi:hypothetical protein
VAKDADDHGYVYAGPRAKRLTAEQFIDAVWQLTGAAPTKMDASVLRGKVDPEIAKRSPSTGQWIWSDNPQPAAGETITLRKTIKLDADPASASAVVTCDNGYTLFVNNRKVSEGTDWTKARRRAAANRAQERCRTSSSPSPRTPATARTLAGFFFDARVRDAAGQETIIATDDSWEWSAASAWRQGRPHGSL